MRVTYSDASSVRTVKGVAVAREFGELLREIRTRQGLRQSDLAGEGLSASYISMLEHGKRSATPQVLHALATKLGVDASELMVPPVTSELSDEVRWRLAGAEMALAQGDAECALSAFSDLLAAGAPATWGLARAHEAVGDLESALTEYQTTADDAVATGDVVRALDAAIAMARCLGQTRDELRAVTVLAAALAQVERSGLSGSDRHAQALSALMGCHYSLTQFGEATRAATELLALVELDGTWKSRASAYWNAAGVAEAAGDIVGATTYADRAVALLSEGDDQRALARCTVACAWFWLRHPDAVDRLDDIEDMLHDAHLSLEDCGTALDLAYAETELAHVALLRSLPDAALNWADRALEKLGVEPRSQTPDALLVRAEALYLAGDTGAASATAGTLEMTLLSLPHTRGATMTWRSLADLHKRLGDPEAAYRALEGALQAQAINASPLPPAPTQQPAASRGRAPGQPRT